MRLAHLISFRTILLIFVLAAVFPARAADEVIAGVAIEEVVFGPADQGVVSAAAEDAVGLR